MLLGRAADGGWSYPAFYSVGAGSFGFQFGIQNEELLLLIRTEKGLNAVLDNQYSLGPTAGITVAIYGVDAQAATTAALGADIVAFASSRGLFGGIATQLSVLSQQTESNSKLLRTKFRRPADRRADAGDQSRGQPITASVGSIWGARPVGHYTVAGNEAGAVPRGRVKRAVPAMDRPCRGVCISVIIKV